jgi:hypothetical protein
LVSFFVCPWEGEVLNTRCRKSKTILDWIKESVFLDFIGLANGVNRFSSIERSNEIFRGLFCPWRELLDGRPRECGWGWEDLSVDLRPVWSTSDRFFQWKMIGFSAIETLISLLQHLRVSRLDTRLLPKFH